jgi:NADH dehydrogenase
VCEDIIKSAESGIAGGSATVAQFNEQNPDSLKHVLIVGGGFAGLNCARKLAAHPNVRITLLDKNNY